MIKFNHFNFNVLDLNEEPSILRKKHLGPGSSKGEEIASDGFILSWFT